MNREVYRVTIHPGRNIEQAVARLARLIIDRWMPGHAGGVVVIAGPQLCQLLAPLFAKAERERRSITLSVDTTDPRPVITEIP